MFDKFEEEWNFSAQVNMEDSKTGECELSSYTLEDKGVFAKVKVEERGYGSPFLHLDVEKNSALVMSSLASEEMENFSCIAPSKLGEITKINLGLTRWDFDENGYMIRLKGDIDYRRKMNLCLWRDKTWTPKHDCLHGRSFSISIINDDEYEDENDVRLPLSDRILACDDIVSGIRVRGPPWRFDQLEFATFHSSGTSKTGQRGSSYIKDRPPSSDHANNQVYGNRTWDKRVAPIRLDEIILEELIHPSTRSICKASKDGITLSEKNSATPHTTRVAISGMIEKSMGNDKQQQDPICPKSTLNILAFPKFKTIRNKGLYFMFLLTALRSDNATTLGDIEIAYVLPVGEVCSTPMAATESSSTLFLVQLELIFKMHYSPLIAWLFNQEWLQRLHFYMTLLGVKLRFQTLGCLFLLYIKMRGRILTIDGSLLRVSSHGKKPKFRFLCYAFQLENFAHISLEAKESMRIKEEDSYWSHNMENYDRANENKAYANQELLC